MNRNNIIAVALAIMMVGSVFVGAAAAAPTWDSETTTTSTTSDQQGSGHTVVLNTSATDEHYYVELDGASTDEDYTLKIEDSNTTLYTNASATNMSADGHRNWNITENELGDNLPRTYDGNDQFDVVVTNSSGDEVLTDTVTVNASAENNEFDIAKVTTGFEGTSDLAVDDIETNDLEKYFGLKTEEDAITTFEIETGISNNTSAVVVEHDDDHSAENFELDTFEDGDRLNAQFVTEEAGIVGVYKGTAPDKVADSDMSYAVVADHDDDGAQEMKYMLGDEYDDASSVDAEAVAGEDYGVWTQFSEFRFNAFSTSEFTSMFGA